MRAVVAAGAAVLMMTACSGTPDQDLEDHVVDVAEVDQEESGPVVADPVEWDVPVVVEGAGGAVELAPSGLRYVSTEEISSPTEHDHPSRQMFAVVRFTVTTDADTATIADGWMWRQGGQEYGPGDGGHAGTAPWMGAIPDVHTGAVLMGGDDPSIGYVTFDLAEEGGELAFTGADGAMVRWIAPEQDQGRVPELVEWLSAQ